MPLLLGPILGFRGCDGGVWRVSVLEQALGSFPGSHTG